MVELTARPKILPGLFRATHPHVIPSLPLPWGRRVGGWFGGTSTGIHGWTGATHIGTQTGSFNSTDGQFMRNLSGALANDKAGVRFGSTAGQLIRKFEAAFVAKIRVVEGLTAARVYVGLHSASGAFPTGDDPLNGASGVLVGFRSTDTEFTCLYNGGAGVTLAADAIATGLPRGESRPAVDASFHEIQIYSPYDEAGWIAMIDGKQIARLNPNDSTDPITDIPGSTTGLWPVIMIETAEAVAKNIDYAYYMGSSLK